ncbi:CDP-alcohol phosphatidyltransferase family protein [Wenzhouxiangella marina]|uniref:CDP-diacylglycerol--glycerol-3-phosphate 3-phosphatidyltransferase n=1 Tax=Wenzhouxiangella marina TaxID=1579979 RepID=A0A0K0XYX5_9GAMM|nr:CDP-alcohol phosphatidyltransferase family protein [Wenzhouxiangella marina]AKS42826.1 CDP-alcohol phosphatidyltransferase family protein [Wenzhouxiangella marina]MBB6087495.1 cardiolipin synthase [Wenzhouxiangella marina]
MNLAWIPNVLTVGRMLAVPPLVALLVAGRYDWALAVAVAAGLSDLLDGWLARRFGWQSRFGGLADPAADKILMVASYMTLAWLGYLPWWLFGLVILRDLVIVIGGWVYHVVFERLQAEPTQLSRFNTFCQVFLMWFVLVRLAGFPLPPEAQIGLEWLVAFMAVVTLVQYTWLWSMRAVRITRERRAGERPPR